MRRFLSGLMELSAPRSRSVDAQSNVNQKIKNHFHCLQGDLRRADLQHSHRGSALGPVAAVQRFLLDGLGEVCHGQMVGAFQVGDRAGHLQDAVMGSRRSPCCRMARSSIHPASGLSSQ